MALYSLKGQYEWVSRNVNGPMVKLRLELNVHEIETIQVTLIGRKALQKKQICLFYLFLYFFIYINQPVDPCIIFISIFNS